MPDGNMVEELPTRLSSHSCSCGHSQSSHGNVAPNLCLQGLWSGGKNFEGEYLGFCPCEGYVGANADGWTKEREFKIANRRLQEEIDGDLLGYETVGDRDFWLSLMATGYDGPVAKS